MHTPHSHDTAIEPEREPVKIETARKPEIHNEAQLKGIDMANMFIDQCVKAKDPNMEFNAIRVMALHILGGQIFNIGMGCQRPDDEEKSWDASRAFVAEKDIIEDLQANIAAWKNLFESGQIRFTKNKV